MPISTGELMSVVVDVMSHENARTTTNASLKGGLLAGIGAVIGGLALGRSGLTIGGLLGGLYGTATCTDFKTVYEIIRDDLSSEQRESLANRLRRLLQNAGVDDVMRLTALAYAPNIQSIIVKEVIAYCNNDLLLQISQ